MATLFWRAGIPWLLNRILCTKRANFVGNSISLPSTESPCSLLSIGTFEMGWIWIWFFKVKSFVAFYFFWQFVLLHIRIKHLCAVHRSIPDLVFFGGDRSGTMFFLFVFGIESGYRCFPRAISGFIWGLDPDFLQGLDPDLVDLNPDPHPMATTVFEHSRNWTPSSRAWPGCLYNFIGYWMSQMSCPICID